jgi:small subunit ribosomal protein S8
MSRSHIHLLLTIKTASLLQKERVQVPLKFASLSFLTMLYKHGIIQNFIKIGSVFTIKQSKILIYLRYFFSKPIVKNLKFFSKPSLYLYLSFNDVCLINDKKHTLFISTSKGILTNLECKIKKIGGIVLFKC